LPMDEVEAFRDKFVSRARAEADKKIEDSEKKAAEISTHADEKIKEITQLVVNTVTGRS
jgi:vacuolar-type H+-ATPase subunit H